PGPEPRLAAFRASTAGSGAGALCHELVPPAFGYPDCDLVPAIQDFPDVSEAPFDLRLRPLRRGPRGSRPHEVAPRERARRDRRPGRRDPLLPLGAPHDGMAQLSRDGESSRE